MSTFDHLVYATPSLAGTVADFAARGLVLGAGGSHVGFGTRNFLADLGDGGYLEVVGPDPDQPNPSAPRPFHIDSLSAGGLVTWAVRVEDMDAAVARAREAGYDPGTPYPMSRRTADGDLLEWRLATVDLAESGGVVPFLIEWGDTPHPSGTAVRGAALRSFTATHPDPDAIRRRLDALDVSMEVRQGDRATLTAHITSPEGEVVLTCAS